MSRPRLRRARDEEVREMLTDEQLQLISAEALAPAPVVRRVRLTMPEDVGAAELMAAMVRLVADHPSTASRTGV